MKIFRYKNILIKALNILNKNIGIEDTTEVSVILVNNEFIQRLNKEYRKIDKPTDVLSFSSYDKNLIKQIHYNMLGDIYISLQKVKEQAKIYNHSFKREFVYICIHGFAHLYGYDHKNKKDEEEMNTIVDNVINEMDIRRK